MVYFILYLAGFFSSFYADNPSLTPFEKSKGTQTATYEEIIAYYRQLDHTYKELIFTEAGQTDIGKPLHLVTISNSSFDPEEWKKQGKVVILINNGIHPGEPEGIDASMMLARDLLSKPAWRNLLDHVVCCIIPVYNVDGCLNRNATSRMNQNGPPEYGFRANAKNLDLNRDFIKCDSKNARSFSHLFQLVKPDIFIDTHTSNGADYQYTMTYIPTQKDKMQKDLAAWMYMSLIPGLEKKMQNSGYEMIPYVNTVDETPDSGIVAFFESPRYSTGYTTLFNTIGFTVETHMLKPFDERVKSTAFFLSHCLEIAAEQQEALLTARRKAAASLRDAQELTIVWKQDSSYLMIPFKGYEASYKTSNLGAVNRLYYDRSKPFTKQIRYYQDYKPMVTVKVPEWYIVPQAWQEVLDRLEANGVQMKRLKKDTVLSVESYYIRDYKTLSFPFEGHYLHHSIKAESEPQQIRYFQGDYLIPTNQFAKRFIVETLEPQATDSYFAWNFFDAMLTRKEGYSDYVFDEKAAEILTNDAGLRKQFEQRKASDSSFARSWGQQLDFIYRNSAYMEKGYLRYPVSRMMHANALPITD